MTSTFVEVRLHRGGDQREIYTTGDKVKGTVMADLSSDKTITKVMVRFKGALKVDLPRRDEKAHTKIILFQFEQQLYAGSFAFGRGRHEWPFEFEFPACGTPYFAASCLMWPSISDQNMPPKCALPPSLQAGSSNLEDYEVQVDYSVKASLHYEGRPLGGVLDIPRVKKANVMLDFRPARGMLRAGGGVEGEEDDDDELESRELYTQRAHSMIVHSALLRPDDEMHHKDRLKMWFHGDKLSVAQFDVILSMPTAMEIGQQGGILASVRHVRAEHSLGKIPEVRIETWQAEMRAEYQILYEQGFLVDCPSSFTFSECYPLLVEGADEPVELPADGTFVPIGSVFGDASSGRLEPSFRILSLSQTHYLRLHVTVACADKTKSFKTDYVPFKLLTNKVMTENQDYAMMMSPSIQGPEDPFAAAPPSYQEAIC